MLKINEKYTKNSQKSLFFAFFPEKWRFWSFLAVNPLENDKIAIFYLDSLLEMAQKRFWRNFWVKSNTSGPERTNVASPEVLR